MNRSFPKGRRIAYSCWDSPQSARKLIKKIVHRMETVRAIAGLDAGEVIGADHLAKLASHPESYPSRFPKSTKRILYLSHCTSPKALEDAQAIFEAVTDGIYDYLLTGDSVAGKFYSRRVHKMIGAGRHQKSA